MNTAQFLTAIWPLSGVYCLMSPNGKRKEHIWPTSIPVAVTMIDRCTASGRTVYHACAAYKDPGDIYGGRKADNARSMRSLWLDLDVGEGEGKFASITEASQGLKQFIATVGLPDPLIVASGGGLHVYWPFEEEIGADEWWGYARSLKHLTQHYGFKVDPMRTSDRSSVLRPVGSANTKYNPFRQVKVVHEAPATAIARIAQILERAEARVPKEEKPLSPLKLAEKSVNSQFMPTADFPPSDPNKVADRCAQVRMFRDTRGNISEPHWYTGIQLLNSCVDGARVIHEWSSGHPDYDRAKTDAKINQVKDLGPAACATFEARNPGGCAGCPHKSKITSPIQLGTTYLDAPAPPARPQFIELPTGTLDDEAVTFVKEPQSFRRTANGIIYITAEDVEVQVYPYDLIVTEILKDDTHGYEVCMVRHNLPKEGWQEFCFRSSAVSSLKEFEAVMRDNHIKPLSSKLLCLYVTLFMAEVQRVRKMRPLYHTMGWKDDMGSFVLGDKRLHANGAVEVTTTIKTVKPLSEAMQPKGTLEAWTAAAAVLDEKGMEAHAMMFGAGPGAPLMRFTGFEAAMLNAVGETNSGKTSMARLMLSMYGNYDVLKLRQQDTYNSKIQRIAALGSLPSYIDEVTNIDPKDLGDMVYEISQGRSKLRLKQDGTERETHEWNTVVVSSSNSPLSGRLGMAKANPEAERMRLFEFRVGRQSRFDGVAGTRLFELLAHNYGHAGQAYLRFVVTHQEEIRRRLIDFGAKFRDYCKGQPEERYWMATITCSLFGLKLMTELGLLNLDVDRVVRFAASAVKRAREQVADAKSTALEMLGHYMNLFASTRITLRQTGETRAGDPQYTMEHTPLHEIHMRLESVPGRCWIDSRHLERWLNTEGEDWGEFCAALRETGVLVRRIRKTLGAGTPFETAQVSTLELNMKVPILGNQNMMLLVADVAAETRRKTEGRDTL